MKPVEPVARPVADLGSRMLLLAGLGGGTTVWTLAWVLLAQWFDAALVACVGGVGTVLGAGCFGWAGLALRQDWTAYQVWEATVRDQARLQRAQVDAEIAALYAPVGEAAPVSPVARAQESEAPPAPPITINGQVVARVASWVPRRAAGLPSGETQPLPTLPDLPTPGPYAGSDVALMVDAITAGQGYSVRAMQGRMSRERHRIALDWLIGQGFMEAGGDRQSPRLALRWANVPADHWHDAARRLWGAPSPTEG